MKNGLILLITTFCWSQLCELWMMMTITSKKIIWYCCWWWWWWWRCWGRWWWRERDDYKSVTSFCCPQLWINVPIHINENHLLLVVMMVAVVLMMMMMLILVMVMVLMTMMNGLITSQLPPSVVRNWSSRLPTLRPQEERPGKYFLLWVSNICYNESPIYLNVMD